MAPLAHAQLTLPRAALLSAFALAALAVGIAGGASADTTLASIIIEDGSSQTMANDTILIDGSLGGPHAGAIVLANNSHLTLNNVTMLFLNDSADGGIALWSGSRLDINASIVGSAPAARFAIFVTGGASLRVKGSNVTGLQATEDLEAPAISIDAGASLWAEGSTLRVRPDLRPLLAATQADVNLTSCTLGGAMLFVQSTARLTLITHTVIGEVTALESSASSVVLSNSTVTATGGASAVAASQGGSLTVRSTNLSAEDIGVAATGASTVTLESVVVEAGTDLGTSVGAFALAIDGSTVAATNVAFLGFTNSLWAKNSQVTLTGTQLGEGLLRLNTSTVTIDGATAIAGIVFLEKASTLFLTDTALDWSRVDLVSGSVVIPRYRHTMKFFDAAGDPAPGVIWTVLATSGAAIASGISDSAGQSTSPPLEGPRYTSDGFLAAASYRLQLSGPFGAFNETITAWGAGLDFPFYLDAALNELSLIGPLQFSQAHPPVSEPFTVSASLSRLTGSAGGVSVRIIVDGVEGELKSIVVTSVGPSAVDFTLVAKAGLHLITIRVDREGTARGAYDEQNEVANNFLAMWYNASTNVTASVKPDLVVLPGGIRFDFVNTTAPDPVTGGARDARNLVVILNITNTGLTGAGPFDVVIAAGQDWSRATVPGIPSGASTTVTMDFGPYIDSQNVEVLAQLDVQERVDEGSEGNNRANATAAVVLPAYVAPPRPFWVTALVFGAAAALLGLTAWGLIIMFKGEEEEDLVPEAAKAIAAAAATPASPPAQAPAPSAPAAPPFGPPAPAQAPPPPPMRAAAPPAPPAAPPPYAPAPFQPPPAPPGYPQPAQRPAYPPQPPQPPAYGWGGPGYHPAPANYPGYRAPPPPPPSPYAPPQGPPTRCPRCASIQLSYQMQPPRQAICQSCQTRIPF